MDLTSNYHSHRYDAKPAVQPATNHTSSMPALRIAPVVPPAPAPANPFIASAISLVDPGVTAAGMYKPVSLDDQAMLSRYLKVSKIRREAIVKFEFVYNGYTVLVNPCESVEGGFVGTVALFCGCVRDRFTAFQLENAELFA